jgi:hypothetical protein
MNASIIQKGTTMYYFVETVYIPDIPILPGIHDRFIKDIECLYRRVDIFSKILEKTDNQVSYVLMLSEVRGEIDEVIDHLNECLFGKCGQTVYIKVKKIRDADFLAALVETSDNGYDLIRLNKSKNPKINS